MPAGRPGIARGRVEVRSFWKDVAVGDERGYPSPGDQYSRTQHWYWMRPSALIFGHWKASGEKPVRVLFYELRPEEWDARPSGSRLITGCGVPECVNPWHAEFAVPAGAEPVDEMERLRSGPDIRERLSTEDMITVLTGYMGILMDEDGLRAVLGPRPSMYTGRINPGLRRVKETGWSPAVIAGIERCLADRPMMTVEETSAKLEEIEASARAEREKERKEFAAALAAATRAPRSRRARRA